MSDENTTTSANDVTKVPVPIRLMRLVVTPLVQRDLETIGDYIAEDNPAPAVSFICELRSHCSRIQQNPLAYRLRSDIAAGLRSEVHGRYVIYFTARNDSVRIVRILHGAMDAAAHLYSS